VTLSDFVALLPLGVLAFSAMLQLVVMAFVKSPRISAGLAGLGFLGAFLSLVLVDRASLVLSSNLFLLDSLSDFFLGMSFVAACLVVIISFSYLRRPNGRPWFKAEFYFVLVLATLGAAVTMVSHHGVTLFLGLGLLSLSSYVLVAFRSPQDRALEAAIKYVIVGSAASAFLLMGLALIYTGCGSLDFLAFSCWASDAKQQPLLQAGLGLLVISLGIKAALVPFHQWSPDVYQGASCPVTAFLSGVSKVAVVVVVMRLGHQLTGEYLGFWNLVLSVLACASMVGGSLLALLQTNIKRLLAYSSMVQLGFLLIGLVPADSDSSMAVSFFLVVYVAATTASFGVLAALSTPHAECEELQNLSGLAQRNPGFAAVLATAMFSLAGIPLTGGFVAKLMLIKVGLSSSLWLLVGVLIMASLISLYYYLRVIVVLYMGKASDTQGEVPSSSVSSKMVIWSMTAVLMGLGVWPALLWNLLG
jgi:NADH-quinone oxidoreductase subunit N